MILEKRVALITGAAKGIGRQIAMDMVSEGAKVIICDIDCQAGEATQNAIRQKGGEALFIPVDVSKFEDINYAVKKANDIFGTINILVPNASITSRRSIVDLTLEEWDRTLRINLTGTFLTVKAIIPQMLEQGYGRIIVITSASAITGSGGGVHYAATKAGQNAMVRNLAREFAPMGINANAIAPRTIQTEILDVLYPPGDTRDRLINTIPVRRLGNAKDISDLAVFLASAQADYINGQIMLVDGGKTFS